MVILGLEMENAEQEDDFPLLIDVVQRVEQQLFPGIKFLEPAVDPEELDPRIDECRRIANDLAVDLDCVESLAVIGVRTCLLQQAVQGWFVYH